MAARDVISVDFVANTAGASRPMRNLAKVAGGLSTVLVAAGTAALALGAKAVKSAGDIEKQIVAFETLLGSAERARDLFGQIQDFSAATPFQLDDLTTGAQRLIAFGTGAEDVISKLENLGNAAQGNSATLDRLVNAYGKLQAKGRASLEELNMFTEAGVPIMEKLREQLGLTKEELFDYITQGKVGFEDVDKALEAMTTGQGQFAGMLDKQSRTLNGLMSTLKDNISLIGAEIGESYLPAVKEGIEKALGFLRTNKDLIVGIFSDIPGAAKIAFEAVGEILQRLFEWDTIELIVESLMINIQRSFRAAFKMLGDVWSSLFMGFAQMGDSLGENWFKHLVNGITRAMTTAPRAILGLLGIETPNEGRVFHDADLAGMSLGKAFTDAVATQGPELVQSYREYWQEIGASAATTGITIAGMFGDIITDAEGKLRSLATPGPATTGGGGGGSPEPIEAPEAPKKAIDSWIMYSQRIRESAKATEYLEAGLQDTAMVMSSQTDPALLEHQAKIQALQDQWKAYGEEVKQQLGNSFVKLAEQAGRSLTDLETEFESLGTVALEAIAGILKGLAQQFIVQAAGAAALGAFGKAAALLGAAALAGFAGGAISGAASNSGSLSPTTATSDDLPSAPGGRVSTITNVYNIQGSVVSENQVRSLGAEGYMQATGAF